MSGTRYADCTRCEGLAKKFDERVKGFLKLYYGKIDAEEYEALRKCLKIHKNPFADSEGRLRLDYGAFVKGNTLKFSAGANCDVCGFEVSISGEAPGRHQSKSQEIFEAKIIELQTALDLPRAV